jgi:broad specificity phosphatase PhoE
MEKRLILIRHAHRETDQPDRLADNGLSPKGWSQAEALARIFHQRFKSQKPVLKSSGKTRCLETLELISKLTGVPIQKDARLMEQETTESNGVFQKRIDAFIEWWKKDAPELVVACSHGDWLPVAIDEMTGQFVDMKKGAWVELELRPDKIKLLDVIQRPEESIP